MNRFMKRKQTEVWLREGLRKEKMKTVAEKEKADRTALLSTQAYRTALGRKLSLNFRGLLLRQVRYTGWMVWLWQAVLFLGIMAVYHVLFRTVEGTVDLFFYRRLQDFLCGAGILSAWSSVPFLFRSYRWNMAEVEAASRCSMLHLRGYDPEGSGLEAVRMREREEAVLLQLGLPRTVSYTNDEILYE